MKKSDEQDVNFVKDLIKKSLLDLREKDINLIEYTLNNTHKDASNNSEERKLHETCINHRLAVYIEDYLKEKKLGYFVDIEYNKYRYIPKEVMMNGSKKRVRPDIIVHTRVKKIKELDANYLIIETKKDKDSRKDEIKIKAFMKDSRYCYRFGCKIKYGDLGNTCDVKIYYSKDGNNFEVETIFLK